MTYAVCFALSRIVLPVCLAACVLVRQNLLSYIYFLLFLFCPWIKVPTQYSMTGATGIYLFVVFLCSILTFLTQLIFHIVLLTRYPYGIELSNCGLLEKILRHVGLVRLNGVTPLGGAYIIGPEILMLVFSSIVYIVCKRASRRRQVSVLPASTVTDETKHSKAIQKRRYSFFSAFGKYTAVLSLGIAGVIFPSVLNGIYFIIFLGSMTWWACNKNLGRGFAVILYVVLFIVTLHITAIFCMQLQYVQEYVTQNSDICRYLGLKMLVHTNCLDPGDVWYLPGEMTYLVNPLILMWTYYILALQARQLVKQPNLIRGVHTTVQYRATDRGVGTAPSSMFQDPHGSVTITNVPDDSIQLQPIGTQAAEEQRGGVFEIILDFITLIIQLVGRSSYIGANMVMMAWSITHHSWLTFVLLLWASCLWMFPNQRQAMLRSSPFLVFYAELLLLIQYIYGMELTDAELPEEVKGVNLKQIGFEKPQKPRAVPLLIKVAYTMMLWITLRQYMQEKSERRARSTLLHLAAPLQVTVDTATTGFGTEAERSKTYSFFEQCFKYVKLVMVKYFIWVVVIMLFVIGITGERMTLFRIIYMALFLVFLVTFQLSYRLWRKMMYAFWLTVIVYSMTILIVIYTYQFDNVPYYWTTYLHIPETLQLDIGLERYYTTQLFERLLTPTAFLVMTVIQLNYFHKEFLKISDIGESTTSAATSRSEGSLLRRHEDERPESLEKNKITMKHILRKFRRGLQHATELIWLFLELHMLKIALFTISLICVDYVCAIHLVLLVMAVISFSCGKKIQVIVGHICSVAVSILILAQMIYQIGYILHDYSAVNCSILVAKNNSEAEPSTYTLNTMEWIGFHKSSVDHTLVEHLRVYIGFILVATLSAVVSIRQKHVRRLQGYTLYSPTLMFPSISREEADQNISSCIKYLFNYGFYKFGLEACLIMTVILIGVRMDFYSVLYSFWVCLLFAMERERVSRAWIFYQIFITIIIPLQYSEAVGLPPAMCTSYPWYYNERLSHLQEWMFLPNPVKTPPVRVLICDIILLMMVCRQAVVFRIERNDTEMQYRGGSNKDITDHFEDPSYVVPVPDHVSYVRSWLDIVKRIVLRGFIWLTLAIVFLAGTSRVSVFSLGYLCGSFIFLWQGEEFYLKPIRLILKWWNLLLGYNVAVIVIKTLLQIPGCMYGEEMHTNHCWLSQLFNIECLKVHQRPHLTEYPGETVCNVETDDVGLEWDTASFVFILMMRRLFYSNYFVHLINEAKAMAILASRGAELIEELRQKQIVAQQEREREILEKIKHKMERIKAAQQKMKGVVKEVDNHYVAQRNLQQRKGPNHKEAMRSGDYYMFEEFDVDYLALEGDKEETSHKDSVAKESKRITLSKLLTTALNTNIAQATDLALSPTETEKRFPEKRPSFVSAKSQVSPDDLPGTSKTADTTDAEEAVDKKAKEKETLPTDYTEGQISELPSEEGQRPWYSNLWIYMKFGWALVLSSLETFINYLNHLSRDYRYISKVLSVEKRALKEQPSFGEGYRTPAGVWQPSSGVIDRRRHKKSYLPDSKPPTPMSARSEEGSSQDDQSDKGTISISKGPKEFEEELAESEQPLFIRLFLAVWFAIFSHSELVCYFMVFLHQVKSATIISLPLPLMVFLWGTLTVPRPSKTFWVTLIAYTEVIVVVKCLFQFELLPWNQQAVPENVPFFPPRILGIEREKHYAVYDLLVLLICFLHRYMLKSLGLWTNQYDEAEFIRDEEVYEILEDTSSQSLVPESASLNERAAAEKRQSSLRRRHIKCDILTAGGRKLVFANDADEDTVMDNLVVVKTDEAEPLEHIPAIFWKVFKKYLESTRDFFRALLHPSLRVAADVYAYMFLCDFFNFFVVIIGFSSFGTQIDGGVTAYIQENKVPVPFLVMMILQFVLIIIDRSLFLRKFILGKIIFQFVIVIGVHIWMFFVLPAVTERRFAASLPPQIWYMVKCFYLLLSAYQIRSGYPTRILGNFVCKGYSIVNLVLFKIFMNIPFLFELRSVMDWIWTDTTMALFDWLKMEDIFNIIYEQKCWRKMEEDFPQGRGEKKPVLAKYLQGGGFLLLIIGLIWFPLVFFALGSAVGVPNIPVTVYVDLSIENYHPLSTLISQNSTIYRLNEKHYSQFMNLYKKDRAAQTFLSGYNYDDIAAVEMNRNSSNVWSISPPDQQRLIDEILSDNTIVMSLKWTIEREAGEKSAITASKTLEIPAVKSGKRNPIRTQLHDIIAGKSNEPIIIQKFFPKFLKVSNRGTAKAVTVLLPGKDDDEKAFRNISLRLLSGSYSAQQSSEQWWEITELCDDVSYQTVLEFVPFQNCDHLVIYTFNDKSFPSTLSFFSAGGIIGLYSGLVYISARVLRSVVRGAGQIIYTEMPCVDRILQLCLDVYLVRESGEMELEEDLYAKLLFLFRSPETLIKWSRPREEGETGEDIGALNAPPLESGQS